ncbi:MAG: hypothetical protein HY476_03940 [Nitrosarchaeum sp.]|nr:hypothetical protein [Nitrosarchaeum sp.]
MVSYPTINLGDKIESDLNSSNYLITAFAEEDDEDEQDDETKDNEDKETDENETEDDGKDDDAETKGENLEDANGAIADAEKEVNRAQEKIAEAKENKKDTFASEIALEEAQDKLKEAKENFELGLYGIAEELADEAEDLASDARMSLLGKGVEDIEDDLDDETEDETEDELDDEDIEDEGETEIEVEVKNDKAKVKIELNGEKYRFVVTDVSESVIINAIMNKTGLTEDEITTIWDFEVEDETEDDDSNGLQTSEKIMKHENKAKENAEETILQLQQKIDQLEERLQNLLDKFETGEYFGTVINADTTPDAYSVSFDGLATSLNDDLIYDMDGDIYLESITTGTDSFKLRITGGEILIGDTFYDFVFGKARLSSSDDGTSMVILGQVMDDQGNVNTIRLTLDATTAFTSDFDSEPFSFEIDPSRSKIAKQWTLDASGDFSLLV